MKKVVQVGLVVLLLAAALSACGPKAAANHLDQIKQNGKITIGTSADYPPFESVDASGNFVGFDVDMMNEIGKRMGVDVEIVDMPFDSLLAAVQEGKIDISIAAFNYNEERDQTVDFTDPYYNAEDGFLVADNFAGQINAPEDIASMKVGVQTGSTADGWVTDNLASTGLLPEENLFRYERMDQAALDVKNGRIDVLMTDYIPAEALAKQVGGVKVIYHAEVSTGPVNVVVPEGDTALTEALNKIIKDMLDDGTIDQIAIKNIGS